MRSPLLVFQWRTVSWRWRQKNVAAAPAAYFSSGATTTAAAPSPAPAGHPTTATGPLLKHQRPFKKRPSFEAQTGRREVGVYNVVAYATADQYDLSGVVRELSAAEGGAAAGPPYYDVKPVHDANGVLHVTQRRRAAPADGAGGGEEEEEPREIFIFREGSVVLWNCAEGDRRQLLHLLRPHQVDAYDDALVQTERETMCYMHQVEGRDGSQFHKNSGDFRLDSRNTPETSLNKYTLSNAMVLSVKLGIWEARLEHFIAVMQVVAEDLKCGRRIRMSRAQVLRKQGELFALRHDVNLGSDLLDTPDFYWENEHLEKLYVDVCHYFSISKRTKVINEKINHCSELVELVSSHLSDEHHVRLEWMIIVLIMVEVAFESLHYVERFI